MPLLPTHSNDCNSQAQHEWNVETEGDQVNPLQDLSMGPAGSVVDPSGSGGSSHVTSWHP